ncbi:MAG: pseudouridine synthase [Alphaproteobacteria bacterium]
MAWTRSYDLPDPQRVNKWLAQSGVCSRREAEALIGQGLVSIDGEVVTDAGRKITSGQTLTLADAATTALADSISIVLHKPVGIVSAQPEKGEIPAVRLLTPEALWGPVGMAAPRKDESLPALGRLDKDSRGFLILSNDGVLAKALIGPESALDKEYRVFVIGEVTPEKIALLRHGLELDGRKLRPAEVDLIADRRMRIVLREGRNRQIRRMCELVELKVVDLFRVRIGPLQLGEMPEGRWRPVTPIEREFLIGHSIEK